MPKKKRLAGRPAIGITKPVLKKLEALGASGISQRGAAAVLRMSEDTFRLRRQDNQDFAARWEAGRARYWNMVQEGFKAVVAGLLKNATTKTKGAPGGNVAAQLGFIEKVARRSDAETIEGHVSLEEIGGGQEAGPVEIQEVRFRRIKRGAVDKGRIEDGIFDGDN